ncbi:hypothetical protein DFH09DRAFT_1146973 [Mycena vulgaris]|nr:hypothetical protein DFH09DRAFT_1146973 [Mycena vulgaris]
MYTTMEGITRDDDLAAATSHASLSAPLLFVLFLFVVRVLIFLHSLARLRPDRRAQGIPPCVCCTPTDFSLLFFFWDGLGMIFPSYVLVLQPFSKKEYGF